MIPRRAARILVLALPLLLAPVARPGLARAVEMDSILRRPADEGAPALTLGPTRQQGDFAPHLDELLAAAAAPESSATPGAEPARAPARAERQPVIVAPILAGLAGGAVGLYGGAVLGLLLVRDQSEDEWRGIAAAVSVGLAGEVILMPLGVHLGNARKGSYGNDLLVSFLGALAGVGLLGVAGGSTEGAIAGAALQFGAVVLTERLKGRERIDERRAVGTP